MGSAIGFTATAGALETLLVFAVLALGLAAPVSVLMLWPAALRWIPKPGEWMVRFRQLLAFPMLATAAWLAWVLAELDGLTALLQVLMAMVLLALSLWAVGAGGRWRVVTLMGFVAIALLFVLRPLQVSMASDDSAPVSRVTAAADEVQWQPWAPGLPQSLAAAGQVVFVDFTAAWCISCQANKARVLRTDPVAGALAQADVVALVADWTRQDPAITQALREQGRNGVPMYLVYPKGGGAPHMLSEWLSSDEVMAALKKAGMGTSKP
jgi:thiol:disulfide interchange protein DsbD